MLQYVGVTIMIVLESLFMTLLLRISKKSQFIYTFSFGVVVYIFIVSAAKLYLGHYKENLFESFADAVPITFVHYGIPLFVIGLVVFGVLKYIWKERFFDRIRFFDSVIFMTFSISGLLVHELNNNVYCGVLGVSTIIFVAFLPYIKKHNPEYISRINAKKRLEIILPVLACWLVTVVLYIPNELYINNSTDFPMSYWYFFGKLLLAGLIIFGVLLAGSVLYLSARELKIWGTTLFFLVFMGYLQGMFLNGAMSILDGTVQSWSTGKSIGNLGIWLTALIIVVALLLWKRHQTWRVMQVICIWLSLTQVVSLTAIIISADESVTADKSALVLTTDGILDIGTESNIIVFVLDKFDERIMEEILAEEPDFGEPLKDFTQYQNATSAFAPTVNSIPFLVTGTEYNDSNLDENYYSYAYEGDNTLIRALNQRGGYNVGVYTDTSLMLENMQDVISNYKDGVERSCDMWELYQLMTRCSWYRMAPLAFKTYYQYDTSDIELLEVNDRITNVADDSPFYHNLLENGLQVNEEIKKCYRFIHMYGAHSSHKQYVPYSEESSQAKDAMKIVYEYIAQLKQLGMYDEAAIFITADHGYQPYCDDNGNVIDISYPIMFVKEPYAKNETQIKVSVAPVCHTDMLQTIRKIAGIDLLGSTLQEIGEEDDRIRTLWTFYGSYTEQYEIDGDVADINNWRRLYTSQNMGK